MGVHWTNDKGYVLDSYKILNGDFNYSNPAIRHFRLATIFPLTFFFKIFGISNFSATLYPMLCSLGMILLSYLFGKFLFNKYVGLIAAFLLSFFPHNVLFASWMMPDVPLAFFSGLCIYLFIRGHSSENEKLFFFFSGALVGISYLVKPSGVIILAFLFPYILYKIWKKKTINKNYLFLFLGIFLVLLFEDTFWFHHSGQHFLRYSMGVKEQLKHMGTDYLKEPFSALLNRIDLYPKQMFNLHTNTPLGLRRPQSIRFGFFYYFVTISLIYVIVKKIFSKISSKVFIPFFWFLLTLLYLEFGTMSITSYVPIWKLPRYLTIITIPGILVLSYFIFDIYESRFSEKFKKLKLNILIPSLIISFLLITSIFYASKRNLFFKAPLYDVKKSYEFQKKYPEKKVFADGGAVFQYKFLSAFQNKEKFEYLTYGSRISTDPPSINNSIVVVNASRFSHVHRNELNFSIPNDWELLKTIEGPEIDMYKNYNPKIYYAP